MARVKAEKCIVRKVSWEVEDKMREKMQFVTCTYTGRILRRCGLFYDDRAPCGLEIKLSSAYCRLTKGRATAESASTALMNLTFVPSNDGSDLCQSLVMFSAEACSARSERSMKLGYA